MKLIIVADLGLLRVYREVKRPQDREPHLVLIEELTPEAAHEKRSDQVTDPPPPKRRRGKPGITIAPSTHAGPDVRINRAKCLPGLP